MAKSHGIWYQYKKQIEIFGTNILTYCYVPDERLPINYDDEDDEDNNNDEVNLQRDDDDTENET